MNHHVLSLFVSEIQSIITSLFLFLKNVVTTRSVGIEFSQALKTCEHKNDNHKSDRVSVCLRFFSPKVIDTHDKIL